jgi:two-component system alkaline phosphatase synthesis response regulator PhoP
MMKEENKRIRILLVDKDRDMLELMSNTLMKENYNVYTASDGRAAIQQAFKLIPHLMILDIKTPSTGGIIVCEYLRASPTFKEVIIAFLSDQNDDHTQIAGLDAGGDDYIVKPIQSDVLVSKVRSLLRRSHLVTNIDPDEIRRKKIIISKANYTVQCGNKLIVLPRKEFELLYMLASNPNKVFRREEIYEAIWGNGIIVGVRTIDVHVRKLRTYIGWSKIRTIKGVGYKFEE